MEARRRRERARVACFLRSLASALTSCAGGRERACWCGRARALSSLQTGFMTQRTCRQNPVFLMQTSKPLCYVPLDNTERTKMMCAHWQAVSSQSKSKVWSIASRWSPATSVCKNQKWQKSLLSLFWLLKFDSWPSSSSDLVWKQNKCQWLLNMTSRVCITAGGSCKMWWSQAVSS